MRIGPESRALFTELSYTWKQGQHVAIFGGTGSGKTRLARELDQIRLDRGGFVVVFVAKLRPDETILKDYKGWTRWKTWKKRPNLTDNRILLWPAVEKLNKREAITLMRTVFAEALDEISKVGLWTVHIDEGLLMCDPSDSGLQLAGDIGLMYSLMRSSHATMITLAQRPAHLPLSIYANMSYAFVGQAKELGDLKRLANLDGKMTARELQGIIQTNDEHEFTLIRAGKSMPPQQVDLAR